jgi:hypothetical protein
VRLADLKGRSVAVWGTGAAARAALRAIAAVQPSRLLAVDDRADYASYEWDSTLAPRAGGDHAFPALVTADVVVGWVPAHPWLAELRARGIPITSGSALWLADHAPRTVAVTGSAVAADLIAHLLAAFDRPVVTGKPLLALPAGPEYVVLLSAAECASLTASPRVAVLTQLPAAAAAAPAPDGRPAFPDPGGAGASPVVGGSGVSSVIGGSAPLRAGDGLPTVPAAAEPVSSDAPASSAAVAWADDQLNLLRYGPEMIVVNGADLSLRDAIRGVTDINRFPAIPAAADDSRFRVEAGSVFCSDDALFPRSTLRLPDEDAGRDLCVALALLDGLGIDVVGAKTELAAAVAAFEPGSGADDDGESPDPAV